MNPRSLSEQLEISLERLPIAFAKLAFLTSVRDPYTGEYLHEGWASMGAPEEIHRILRNAHHEVFEFVCSMPIAQLCAEVDGYLRSLPANREQTLRVWRELESYREMVPQGVCAEEREFFVSQMQGAVEVLTTAPDWARRELASWRFLPPDQRFQRHLEN
jgi:hypothetical protein